MGPTHTTLVEVLASRAQHHPDKQVYTFLKDGATEADTLNYHQLEQRVQATAAKLQSLNATGKQALLLYQPGLEFISAFWGCLHAGVVAVPVYPPRPNQSLSRLQAIIADSQASLALTSTSVLVNLERWLIHAPDLALLQWLATDCIDSDLAASWQQPQVNSDTLAFLQYTSGSTGNPKGVMVSHSNLFHTSRDLDQGWQHTEDSVIVTWLPTFHDMGLVYGVVQPLYKGCSCYLMAPVSFLLKPVRWLQAISHYQATHSGAPNFAYDLCVRKITPEQRASLNLRSWRMALNGAEPVRVDTLQRFTETFKPCGFELSTFCPGYGLAEATLKVTAVRQMDRPIFYPVQTEALEMNQVVEGGNQEQVRTLIGCGYSEVDTKIVIVHPDTLTRCHATEVGEIWVAGVTVAQGYWQRPVETKQTFKAYLADTNEGPFLRTGDLGFIKDGELFVTGRLKDAIVIQGRNHYPQDIELTVQASHPVLRPGHGAAFAVEIKGEERLVVVQEVERCYLGKIEVGEVIRDICQAVAVEHDLRVHEAVLIKTGSIPRTSSGKIRRQACRSNFLTRTLTVLDSKFVYSDPDLSGQLVSI